MNSAFDWAIGASLSREAFGLMTAAHWAVLGIKTDKRAPIRRRFRLEKAANQENCNPHRKAVRSACNSSLFFYRGLLKR
jgi:hypothetical protein